MTFRKRFTNMHMSCNSNVHFLLYITNQILMALSYIKHFVILVMIGKICFNNFLDYIHGKVINFEYKSLHENRYMMMLHLLMDEDEE